MKLITRNTDYAVRALCYIYLNTKAKRIVSVSELARKLKVPQPFLRKILQVLNRHRILKSYKGKKGGFFAFRPAEKVFLVDLIRIFQGSFKLNECFFRRFVCPNLKRCNLRKKLLRIEKYIVRQLSSITIKSLLN